MEIKTVYDAISNIEKLREIRKELDDPKYVENGRFVISNNHLNYLRFLVDDTIKNIQNAPVRP